MKQHEKSFMFTLIFGACANIIIVWYCTLREDLMIEYMIIKEATEKLGIFEHRIQTICNEGMVPRVVKFGHAWAIPKDTKNLLIKELKQVNILSPDYGTVIMRKPY